MSRVSGGKAGLNQGFASSGQAAGPDCDLNFPGLAQGGCRSEYLDGAVVHHSTGLTNPLL